MSEQPIEYHKLPSRGKPYPENSTITVRPLTIREQTDMDRVDTPYAEYYELLLGGVTCNGFSKEELLLGDIQYIDQMRRLFTKDPSEKINVSFRCNNVYEGTCKSDVISFDFNVKDIEYTPYIDELMEVHEISDDGKKYRGKKYTFADGKEMIIGPMTIRDFIDMAKTYINKKDGTRATASDAYTAYIGYCTKHIMGTVYESKESMHKVVTTYIGDLYKLQDKNLVEQIEHDMSSVVVPFNVTCPTCGFDTEVSVKPSTSFQ